MKIENTAVGIRHADYATPSAKVGRNFADKRKSLGRTECIQNTGPER
jgi:hypothetical protein